MMIEKFRNRDKRLQDLDSAIGKATDAENKLRALVSQQVEKESTDVESSLEF
jgi:hypothetical protein